MNTALNLYALPHSASADAWADELGREQLKEDAIQAKEIIQGFQPVFDREGYCRYVENSLKTETADSRKQEA